MTKGLVRYQQGGDLHFVTFSCYRRQPYLESAAARDLFQRSLETMPARYDFSVTGYVVMPEHVHLLIGEPMRSVLATAMQALKLSVAIQRRERPFWQARYYDFNIFTYRKCIEKLRYIHRNPVTRGLVKEPDAWAWSKLSALLDGRGGHRRDRVTMDGYAKRIPRLRSETWGTPVSRLFVPVSDCRRFHLKRESPVYTAGKCDMFPIDRSTWLF